MLNSHDKELRHELKSIGLRFERLLERMLPQDGSLQEDFENWQWAFSRLIDDPGHELLTQTTREAFTILHAKLLAIRENRTRLFDGR